MEVILENLSTVLTVVFLVMSAIFGKKWDKWKKKAADSISAANTIVEGADTVVKSAKDNKVTDSESVEIQEKIKEIRDLFRENEKVVKKREKKRLV